MAVQFPHLSILLIEDDPGDALLVEEMALEALHGVEFVWSKSLEQARARLVNFTPDCILLDLNLPDAKGLNGLSELKELDDQIPVVVMTGLDEDSVGLAAVAAGAQDYLIKGRVEPGLLSRSVRYAIERKRAETHAAALKLSKQHALENARLERGLLPVPLLRSDAVDVVVRYRTGRQHGLLGGDFYDVIETEDGTVHVLIGDICGHGPDEAALGVSLRIAWRTLVLSDVTDETAMRTLEEVLVAERTKDHTFATVTTVALIPDENVMRVLRCGHHGMMVRTAGNVDWLETPGGPALGILKARGKWTAHVHTLAAETAIVLFTDGLFEGLTGNNERLGEEKLFEFAQTRANDSAVDFVDAIIAHSEDLAAEFGGLTDDIAVVHVRRAAQ